MDFLLSCKGQTVQAEVITNSFQKTEIFYSKLKQADNGARFQCVFTIELSNFLKTNINNDISVTITEKGNNLFFGYVRKSVKFTKTQINQPVAIEVVSPSYFLDKTIPHPIAFVNKTLEEIVTTLLNDAGVTNIGTLTMLGYAPKLIKVSEESYKTVLSDLLYEYGFVWDFDDSGVFQIKELFNLPGIDSISQVFDGSNCLDEISISAKESEYDCVKAVYKQVEEIEDALIFRDTTNSDQSGAGTCLQTVAPQTFFGGEEYNYLDCDNDKGEVLFIQSLRPDVDTTSSHLTFTASEKELNPENPNYNAPLGNQICFRAFNDDTSTNHSFTKIDFYGHVFVANAETEAQSYGNKKTQEISLKYICEKEKAVLFAERLTNWYRFSNNEINLKSKTDFVLGSFVKVTDYGIGTYYGRIVKKVTRLNVSKIEYTIETIEEYTPASTSNKTTPNLGGIKNSYFDSILSQSKNFTKSEIEKAQFEASPIYSAIFNTTVLKKLSDGTYSPANISASGRVLQGDEESGSYTGNWHLYINGSEEPQISAHGSSFNVTINEIISTIGGDTVQSVRIAFMSESNDTLIDSQYIPVLTNTSGYTVILDNPFQTYESDENGNIGWERTVTTRARVYYGLQELEYLSADGWQYGTIVTPEYFRLSTNVETGEISITSLVGQSMPDSGKIEIPIFIHSQTVTGATVGYYNETSGKFTIIGYSGATVGYLKPDENGYYYAYFNFQKLSETSIRLAEISTRLDSYWNELTDDLVITEAEKNTLERLLQSVTGEYSFYASHYSTHRAYAAYNTAYGVLKNAVDVVLATTGAYRFSSETEKNSFNERFSAYYSEKSALDDEISSTSTNFTGIDTINKINALNPKPTDFFVWVGTDGATVGSLTLHPGYTYCWNGSAWVEDTDRTHIMTTMDEALNYVKNADIRGENIPAVTMAQTMLTLRIISEDIYSKFATIQQLNAGAISLGGYAKSSDLNGYATTTALGAVDQKATDAGIAAGNADEKAGNAQETANNAAESANGANTKVDDVVSGKTSLDNFRAKVNIQNIDGFSICTNGFNPETDEHGWGMTWRGDLYANSGKFRGNVETNNIFTTLKDGNFFLGSIGATNSAPRMVYQKPCSSKIKFCKSGRIRIVVKRIVTNVTNVAFGLADNEKVDYSSTFGWIQKFELSPNDGKPDRQEFFLDVNPGNYLIISSNNISSECGIGIYISSPPNSLIYDLLKSSLEYEDFYKEDYFN